MLIGRTSLLAISTLTSEINFYTRLIKMKDPTTLQPMFSTFCVELACQDCKDKGKQVDCKHLLHLGKLPLHSLSLYSQYTNNLPTSSCLAVQR